MTRCCFEQPHYWKPLLHAWRACLRDRVGLAEARKILGGLRLALEIGEPAATASLTDAVRRFLTGMSLPSCCPGCRAEARAMKSLMGLALLVNGRCREALAGALGMGVRR